ncbi:MAG: NAD(P)/FAD-dependent oxidoreductase [Pseudoramibacter sp.]
MKTKYLIIGNSAAAIGGVQGIRKVDKRSKIVLVADEPYTTYSRPLISYWLEGRVDREHMVYRNPDFYRQYGVDTMLGRKVTAIDPARHTAALDDGTEITYDQLLLATGSHPFVPPIEGKDQAKNAFTFTTFDDAQGVKKALKPDAKVVIMGGGLIGLKAAEALIDQVKSLTIVDLADRVMPSVLDAEVAQVMQQHLEDLGMVLKLETSIQHVGNKNVTLSDGSKLPYDILIFAVGTRPNQELAEAAGIQCQRGILTDTTQKTSADGVYAAGDCTQSHDISADVDRNIAILPNAFMQGETAGINMAGGQAVFDKAFPVNSMGIKDFYLLTAGSTEGQPQIVNTPDGIRKFYIADDELKGYMILGECQRAGIYTDLIRQKTKLSTVDWDSLAEAPKLMAFDVSVRKADLAQAH